MGEYSVDQYTVSLLHFNDGIKDETGKVWTAYNGAAASTAQSKFGGSSLSLNGVNQYINTPVNADFNMGNGNFTVDFWLKCASNNSTVRQTIVDQRNNSLSGTIGEEFRIEIAETGYLVFSVMTGIDGTSEYDLTSSTKIADTDWHHIACVRANSLLLLFVDGGKVGSLNIGTLAVNALNNPLTIGRFGDYSGRYFNGYIDEFRISNIARWTSDFDPETPNNPDSGKLLLTVTLAEEVEREYDLTKDQADAFVNWYTARSSGTGAAFYTFDKIFNRKDYLPFDKIITFEVTDFTK
jgi:Laminin G domain.